MSESIQAEAWTKNWIMALESAVRRGGSATVHPVIAPPARSARLLRVESAIGHGVPESLRSVLLSFSSEVRFEWEIGTEAVETAALEFVASKGAFGWSLDGLLSLNIARMRCYHQCFEGRRGGDPAHLAWWRNGFVFLETGYGDYFAIIDGDDGKECVVFLQHDIADDEGGIVLGGSFIEFVTRWSELGCPGPGYLFWDGFVDEDQGRVDYDCPAARAWRSWFMEEPDDAD